jgi:hypothetical protein
MMTQVMLAADKILAFRDSKFMVHQASSGVMGGSKRLREEAELLDKINDQMAENYSKKTGKVVLPYVMHPGVKPNPYVEPSVIANRADARQLLKRAFIETVIVRGTTKYEIRVM